MQLNVLICNHRTGEHPTRKEVNKMKNYTTLVKTNGIATKIIKSETEVEAIISAWEEKMNGNTVTVLDEKKFEIIYG